MRGPYIFGELHKPRQGKRSDLEHLHAALKAPGVTTRELYDKHFGVMIKYGSNIQKARNEYCSPRTWKTRVAIIYGDSGTGKTFNAMRMYVDDQLGIQFGDQMRVDNTFMIPICHDKIWFDGYDPEQHDTVVFDEFQGQMDHHNLLRLIDEYPIPGIEIKGNMVKWKPKLVVFTMNTDPLYLYRRTWVKEKQKFIAFWRRVDACFEAKGQDVENDWTPQHDFAPGADEATPLGWALRRYEDLVQSVDAEARAQRRVEIRHRQPSPEPIPRHKPKKRRVAEKELEVDPHQPLITEYVD